MAVFTLKASLPVSGETSRDLAMAVCTLKASLPANDWQDMERIGSSGLHSE